MLFYFIVNISHSCTGVLSVLVEGEHDNSHLLKHNSPLLLLSSPSCLILISLKFKFAVYVTLSPTLTSSKADCCKMEALQCDAKKGELSLECVPVPQISAPDDVIIQVGYAGLCGTDLHIMSVSLSDLLDLLHRLSTI